MKGAGHLRGTGDKANVGHDYADHGFAYAVEVARSLGIEAGSGVTIGHFDEGWNLDHPAFEWMDTKRSQIDFLGEPPVGRGRVEHGTAVLGLHLGQIHRDQGPLLPGARYLLIQSRDTEEVGSCQALADGINLLKRQTPSVLLIARDWSSRSPHLPYELKPGIAALLAEAVAAGIVVAEAAGNGGIDLDQLIVRRSAAVQHQITAIGDSWIDAADVVEPAFQIDTGALIVGACTATAPYRRWRAGFATNPQPRSNLGKRIDCWAQGEQLVTTGAGADFAGSFGGTSGAATLIAAAVALLQSIWIARSPEGIPLTARAIRSLFQQPEMGHPVREDGRTNGSLPDLRKIIDHW